MELDDQITNAGCEVPHCTILLTVQTTRTSTVKKSLQMRRTNLTDNILYNVAEVDLYRTRVDKVKQFQNERRFYRPHPV